MAKKSLSNRMVRLSLSAKLMDFKKTDKQQEVVAYVFSSGGKCITQQTLNSKGSATLQFPVTSSARQMRVFVGPKIDIENLTTAELKRRGAEEQLVRIDPNTLTPKLDFVVPELIWPCWFFPYCFVRGTLLKRKTIGETSTDYPVCHAKVDIYEVDPFFIVVSKLPDSIIEKFRDLILYPKPKFPPIPPVFRETRIVNPSITDTLNVDSNEVTTALNTVSNSANILLLANNTNTQQFRKVIIDHADLLRPILCFNFPIKKQKVATVYTDECGKFKAWFYHGCFSLDKPDLYFEASQKIWGNLSIPIYRPTPISCNTHWNYKCGTEVTLYTKSPFARTCNPCIDIDAPNNWVLVTAIGNLTLNKINLTTDGTVEGNQNLGLTKSGAPFGGTLRLRLDFDNALRQNLNVKYYSVSYRKGTSGAFSKYLDRGISRHYIKKIGDDVIIETYPLGSKSVGSTHNLYEIPPAVPPVGQWTIYDAVEDTTNAKFVTLDEGGLEAPGIAWPAHGKFQLKIDLYDSNGNLVNIDSKGIKYVIPGDDIVAGSTIETLNATNLGLISDINGDGKKSFVMTLHIDNSRCKAELDTPTLNGVSADPACGVIEYAGAPNPVGNVNMPFLASHPNGFGTYRFVLKRGAITLNGVQGNPNTVESGTVSPLPKVNIQNANDLLNGCAVAGFAEDLVVHATATDGWTNHIQSYDARDVRAFVLAPREE